MERIRTEPFEEVKTAIVSLPFAVVKGDYET